MGCPRTLHAYNREISLVQNLSPATSPSYLPNLPWELKSPIYYDVLHRAKQPIRITNKQELRFLANGIYANREKRTPDVMKEAFESSRASAPSGKLGLLRVCKQIYLEAAPIFYQTNHFVVSDSFLQKTYWGGQTNPLEFPGARAYQVPVASNLLPWLEELPTHCMSVLRNITIALHPQFIGRNEIKKLRRSAEELLKLRSAHDCSFEWVETVTWPTDMEEYEFGCFRLMRVPPSVDEARALQPSSDVA